GAHVRAQGCASSRRRAPGEKRREVEPTRCRRDRHAERNGFGDFCRNKSRPLAAASGTQSNLAIQTQAVPSPIPPHACTDILSRERERRAAERSARMRATGNFDKVKDVDPMVALTDATRARIDHWAAKFPP